MHGVYCIELNIPAWFLDAANSNQHAAHGVYEAGGAITADPPVSPQHQMCCIGLPDQCDSRELDCGMCCAGLEDEEDVARDEDAILEDVVVGKHAGDENKNASMHALPAPKGWSAAEWPLHCISRTVRQQMPLLQCTQAT